MIGEAGLVDTGRYTAQYELLRSQVIGAQCKTAQVDAVCQSRGIGLALMLREGMPGWLKAIAAVIRESATTCTTDALEPASSPLPADHTSAPAWLFGVPRQALTALLASLVLSTRSVEQASSREADRSWH